MRTHARPALARRRPAPVDGLLDGLDKQHEQLHDADDAGDFAHGAETRNPRRPGRH
ncbi:hypothetical protein [Streptomyces prasinus]|uniref:hypothetical protein n=1 Tax=Streptomyces prasinus TaxID=67345 RepID=UPI0036867521